MHSPTRARQHAALPVRLFASSMNETFLREQSYSSSEVGRLSVRGASRSLMTEASAARASAIC